MSSSHALLARLAALANADGGFGYAAGKASHPEPTCVALLAFATARDAFAPQITNALAALERSASAPDLLPRLAKSKPSL